MPCRDYETDNETYYDKVREIDNLKSRLDNVTKLLCFTLTALERGDSKWLDAISTKYSDGVKLDEIEVELMQWWENHKKLDEVERLKKIRKKLRKVLTEEEIEFILNR